MITVYRVTFNGGWREFLTQEDADLFKTNDHPSAEISVLQKKTEREPYLHATNLNSD
jgi:hypothetical protein